MDSLLKKLLETDGISGYEEPVRSLIEKEIKPYVDETHVGNIGSLIAKRKGGKPRVMLAAHMDEVGLIVKSIDANGRLNFSAIGGIDPSSIIGQRVSFSSNPDIHGVITTSEMVDSNDLEELPLLSDLFVDTGLTEDEIKKEGIHVGSFMTMQQPSGHLGKKDIIYGKALDDRIGCYILVELAKRCHKARTKNELNFVFTVQEEIGLYGALTTAYSVQPDYAIAVDMMNTYESRGQRLVGGGPCLTIKDADMVTNKCLNDWVLKTAKKKNIPIQPDVSDVGTTDALNISISRDGVPSTVLGVAVKNLHTTVGVASIKDIRAAVDLLAALLKKPLKKCDV